MRLLATSIVLVALSACSGGSSNHPTSPPPPTTPSGLTAVGGIGQIALTWTAVPQATSYAVLRADSSGGTAVQIGSATTNSFTDSPLAGGTVWFYRVQAVGPAGTSESSNVGSATVLVQPVPAGVVATGGKGLIVLTWQAAPGATSYAILAGAAASGTKTAVGTAATNAFSETGLAAGSTRFYVVQALGPAGTSGASAEVSASTVGPTAPLALAAAPGNAFVSLKWAPATGATSYAIRRSSSTEAEAQVATAISSAFTDTGVRNGVAYRYTVRAIGAGGESLNSAPATAAPFRLVCVSDSALNQVLVFNAEQANTPPSRAFGSFTGLSPFAFAVDPMRGEIFTANLALSTITTHAETANGNAIPVRTLHPFSPSAIAYDPIDDRILVGSGTEILTFDRAAEGNAAPVRTLQATNASPTHIVLSGDRLFVAAGDLIRVYGRTDSGFALPSATTTITGGVVSMAYDPVSTQLLVVGINAVAAYSVSANGTLTLARTLRSSLPGVTGATGMAVDAGHGILYLADFASRVVAYPTAFADNAAVTPLSILSGPNTRLEAANNAIAYDGVSGVIVVMSARNLLVFDANANADTAPRSAISAAATGFDLPNGIAFDNAKRELLVLNQTKGLTLDAYVVPSANGDVAPLSSLQVFNGSNTFLASSGLFFDARHDEVLVAAQVASGGEVAIFSRAASGAAPALRTISGLTTQLSIAAALGLDEAGDAVVVADSAGIRRYARTFTNGDEAPLTSIQGPKTGFTGAGGLFVDNLNGEIVVAAFRSVSVFYLTDNGDVAPVRKLNLPDGGVTDVFVDPVNNELFVLSGFGLEVFSRTASGNDQPLRVIAANGNGTLFDARHVAICN